MLLLFWMRTFRFWFWSARHWDLGLLVRFIWLSGLIRPSTTSSSCQRFELLKSPLLFGLRWVHTGTATSGVIVSPLWFEQHQLNDVSMEGSPMLPKDFFVVKGVGSALSGLWLSPI